MGNPIKHQGKILFHNGDKFFEDLKPNDLFKTRRSPVIYRVIEGQAAIVDSDTETKAKWFPNRHPVQTLKAF